MLFIRSESQFQLRVATETLPLVSFTQQRLDCDHSLHNYIMETLRYLFLASHSLV